MYLIGLVFTDFQLFHSSLQEFFENPGFRADGLKIYPTLVIRGTGTCTC